MKLFGGSKNGKHTGSGDSGSRAYNQPEQEAQQPLQSAQPPRPAQAEPQPEPRQPKMSAPEPAMEQEPEEIAAVQSPEPNSADEDGLINSIVQAVGLAEQSTKHQNQSQGAPIQPGQSAPDVRRPAPQPKQQPKPQTSAQPKQAPAGGKPPVPPQQPPEKPKMSKGKKAGIIVGSVIGVLVLIVLAALLVMKLWITPPSLEDPTLTPKPTQSADVKDDNGDEPDEEDTNGRKKGCYTFLVVGQDVASGCTDTIMVGRLDTVNHTINVVSIPRDTLMNRKGAQKINSAYAANKNGGGNGVDGIKEEIKKLTGFEVDSYAIVDTKAVMELVDAIGGVEFDVPVNMYYDDPYQDLHIHIDKGLQTLNGENAVKVLRFRHSYAGGDLQRITVQQDFLKALAKQMLDLGNIPNLSKAVKIYEERVQTNLTTGNIAFYVNEFLKTDVDNIQFMTLPNTTTSINGGSFVNVTVSEWLEMVNEYLNPFYTQVTESNVSIKNYYNGNYTYTAGAN